MSKQTSAAEKEVEARNTKVCLAHHHHHHRCHHPIFSFSTLFLRTISVAIKIHLDTTSTNNKSHNESISRKCSVPGRIQEKAIENETPVKHLMSDSIPSSSSNSIRIIRIPMIQIQQRSFSMQEKFLSYISSLECSPIPSTIHTVRKDSGTCIILSSEFESCKSLKNLDPVCAAGDDSDLITSLLHVVDVVNVIMPLPSSLHMSNIPFGGVLDCHLDLDVVPDESFFIDESDLPSYQSYTKMNDVDEFNSDSYQYSGSWKNIGPAKMIVPFSGGDGGGTNPKYFLYM